MKTAAKREVLVSKVLARLYPCDVSRTQCLEDPNLESKEALRSNEGQKRVKDSPDWSECLQDVEKSPTDKQKAYTVSLPPENYVEGLHGCRSSTEGLDESEDTEEDGRRFCRRRRKKRASVKPQAVHENDNDIPLISPHHQTVDHVPINKNKRRKLQRKRQKARLKAAGLWNKTKAVVPNFHGEEEKESGDQPSEEDLRKKSEDLLDFLYATQDLYFTDSKFRCSNEALPADALLEILNCIKSGEMPSSDLTALHNLKTLVLLQDIERLKYSLDNFKEHSSLPFDQRMTLCSLLHYWITDILPMRNK